METVETVISGLKLLADEKYRKGMESFAIPSENAIGVKVPELRAIARSIKKNHELALQLWDCPIHEAKVLASMIADPKKMASGQMDSWVGDIYSWDVCDQCCSNLFVRTPFWKEKVPKWIASDHEFTRRAGIVLIASASMHQNDNVTDKELLAMLRLSATVATDARNFVKKAISWSMRQVGKKRPSLREQVLSMAGELRSSTDKSEKWIGSDVVRELEKI